MKRFKPLASLAGLGAAIALGLVILVPAAQARVTRIVIDKKVSPAFVQKSGGFLSFGDAGHYETIAGRAAADNAVKSGFLLPQDAERLIKQAQASNVLK